MTLGKERPFWFYAIAYVMAMSTVIWFILRSTLLTETSLGLGVGVAFGFFASVGFAFYIMNTEFFRKGDEGEKVGFAKHLHAYWLGAGVAFLFTFLSKANPAFSILTIPPFSVLSTAAQGLGRFDQIIADTVMAPFSETFIFIALFFVAAGIAKLIAAGLNWDSTTHARRINIMSLVIYVVTSIFVFFLFHVALAGSFGFLIAIIFYRTFMGVAVIGDKLFDVIPYVTVLFSWEFGFHFFNNIATSVGFQTWFFTLLSHPFGWFILAILVGLFPLLEVLAIKQVLFGRGD